MLIIKSLFKRLIPGTYIKASNPKKNDLVSKKYWSILRLLDTHIDQFGWVLTGCDAMLYQGLYGSLTKEKSTVFAAEDEVVKGKFYRTPLKTCYSEKRSASTWSRDMALGFMYWCFRSRNIVAIDRHFKFGQENMWVMGDGPWVRTLYNPPFVSLLDQVRFKIKGRTYNEMKKIPQLYAPGLKSYEAHLQVISIALYGEMNGKITKEAFKRLSEHFRRCPKNPLYAAVYSRYLGGNNDFVLKAIENPEFDYDNGPEYEIMHKIDTAFACDYLHRSF